MTTPTPQPAPPGESQAFGRYRIVKKLASGGMGEIYLAALEREEGFSKQLIIKKLLPNLSQNPSFISMFNNEARLAAQLSHTNIVQIFDFGRMDSSYFIAMEWVRGENLADVLSQARLKGEAIPVRVACQIALAAARGLDYAHRKRGPKGETLEIIHRDIAPKNILVSYEGEVKVIDFGLAKAAAASEVTEGGALKGSYCYMSPQQVAGEVLDGRSDLFSLALVLYEMLVGARLFPAEMGLRPLLEAIHKMDLTHWEGDAGGPWQAIPSPLAQILQKALAREPAQRYQTVREFIEALEGFLREANGAYLEVSLSDYMHALFAEKLLAEPAGAGGADGGFDRTRVSEGAQRALLEAADAARAEEGLAGSAPGRISHLLFNLLAFLIIVSILAGGGFLVYHFAVKPRLLARQLGTIRVATDPPQSAVYLDGVPVQGSSPIDLLSIKLGTEHLVRVEKPGYQPQEKKLAMPEKPGEAVLASFTLARAAGQVFLVTDPAGAHVRLDGKEMAAKTPVLLESIDVGMVHDLALEIPKYRAESIQFQIDSYDRAQRFTVEMVPLVAHLKVTSNPSGARIFIDGQKEAKTPFRLDEVEVGQELTVRVKKPGYKGARQTLKPGDGENALAFTLEPLVLEAKLRSKGAVSVLLDEQPVPSNPIRLLVGEHLLRVQVKDAGEELRLRLAVREHPKRENGLLVEVNADARPWAKVRAGGPSGEGEELTTPVSGLTFGEGARRLLVGLPGGARIELSFEVP